MEAYLFSPGTSCFVHKTLTPSRKTPLVHWEAKGLSLGSVAHAVTSASYKKRLQKWLLLKALKKSHARFKS